MTIKISFSGPHGLGKTTKAKLLHSHLRQKGYKVEFIPEMARECPYPLNDSQTIDTVRWMMDTQIERELQAYGNCEFMICDRTVIDHFVYGKCSQNVDIIELQLFFSNHIINHFEKLSNKTSIIFYLEQTMPPYLEQDDVRSLDENYWLNIRKAFRNFINDNNKLFEYNNCVINEIAPKDPTHQIEQMIWQVLRKKKE